MGEDSHPKRPWFRFHLSTCIVLMFVAGALLGLNLERQHMRGRTSDGFVESTSCDLGWPFYFYSNCRLAGNFTGRGLNPIEQSHWTRLWTDLVARELPFNMETELYGPGVRPRELVVNMICWFAILAAMGFLLEWRVRRGGGFSTLHKK